ncbi:S8/S53 family peptidase [Bacteriovorax sp. PP10]|uniref:S8/S53 family peptidase n=1 Tax=Bacteriovorax antarcticus TaxID=3088717 RepID=A0ABU5VWY5_9BACT|nr:S8/S53 family peptidase [Bacteriovorax sp. PP10]MEA9357581.1 S8/S53 family peptidase [Bacteriovorax sp. PP10]
MNAECINSKDECINTADKNLWAQNLTGIDLYRDNFKDHHKIKIGVWDLPTSIEKVKGIGPDLRKKLNQGNLNWEKAKKPDAPEELEHAYLVSNLIAGVPSISTGKSGVITNIGVIENDGGGYKAILEDLKKYPELVPDLVNISHDNKPYDFDPAAKELKTYLKDTIFICSSGNYYPSKADSEGDSPCIFVGSIADDGRVSEFSAEGRSVNILAPADISIMSFDGKEPSKFGGTSAASPYVAGVVSDFLSEIYPLKIDRKKLVEILDKTSLKNQQNLKSSFSNAGIINSFKLHEVALRLKSNPELINSDSLFDFSKELNKDLMSAAVSLVQMDCVKRKEAIKFLRKVFFLSAQNSIEQKDAAKALLAFDDNLVANKSFYESFIEKNKLDLGELYKSDESTHSRIVRSLFDLFPSEDVIKGLESDLNKLSGSASVALMKELAKRNIRKDLIEKIMKDSPAKMDSGMSLKEWGDYLIERFMNVENI